MAFLLEDAEFLQKKPECNLFRLFWNFFEGQTNIAQKLA